MYSNKHEKYIFAKI